MFRLFYPLRYFRLRNNQKRLLDVVPTLVLAALLAAPFLILPGASFFRANGFLDKLLTLTSALTGFYIAALVAAATFTHPDLDKTIRSGTIALVTKDMDGNLIQEALTRREFACAIFAYLAYSALIISAVAVFCIAISTAGVPHRYPGWAQGLSQFIDVRQAFLWLRATSIVVICGAFSHLLVVSCLGVYYLADRLHRFDGSIVSKKPDANDRAA